MGTRRRGQMQAARKKTLGAVLSASEEATVLRAMREEYGTVPKGAVAREVLLAWAALPVGQRRFIRPAPVGVGG